ncbi:hypothetical protein AXK11_07725 [Cephaloticoccus primus]|uniref:Transport permease protein n=1 Tax=Cephaloticoccus primus TaxID=1548207 RepID=A0A139SJM1_9BACT|nr:ABC transporter permease [Cephaloticoccus primus]KXU34723.1 hypothetical protein AXK11_07725 [Cephaloticoccus primus]
MRRIFRPPFIADLWQHRELLWQFTLRNVELRHRGSYLGLVWSFLNPLLMLGLYVMVFGYIFSGRFGVIEGESRIDYGLGIFLGLTLFHFISETLGTAPNIILGNPNFVKKVVFPLEVLPAANVGSAAVHLVISLILTLIGILWLGPGLHLGLLWLPVILLPIILMALGLGWLLSALGTFFRDISQIIGFINMVLLWASGVFFTAHKYPAAWTWLRFNPLLLAIDLARNAALWEQPLSMAHLAYLYAWGLGLCVFGNYVFRKLKPVFADVL